MGFISTDKHINTSKHYRNNYRWCLVCCNNLSSNNFVKQSHLGWGFLWNHSVHWMLFAMFASMHVSVLSTGNNSVVWQRTTSFVLGHTHTEVTGQEVLWIAKEYYNYIYICTHIFFFINKTQYIHINNTYIFLDTLIRCTYLYQPHLSVSGPFDLMCHTYIMYTTIYKHINKYAHVSIYVYRCDFMKCGMLLSLPFNHGK